MRSCSDGMSDRTYPDKVQVTSTAAGSKAAAGSKVTRVTGSRGTSACCDFVGLAMQSRTRCAARFDDQEPCCSRRNPILQATIPPRSAAGRRCRRRAELGQRARRDFDHRRRVERLGAARAQRLEPLGLGQHLAFEAADHLVVGAVGSRRGSCRPASYVRSSSQDASATPCQDWRFPARLRQLLLPPDARHGLGDRDEIGRRREQHAALERPVPKRRDPAPAPRSGNARPECT